MAKGRCLVSTCITPSHARRIGRFSPAGGHPAPRGPHREKLDGHFHPWSAVGLGIYQPTGSNLNWQALTVLAEAIQDAAYSQNITHVRSLALRA